MFNLLTKASKSISKTTTGFRAPVHRYFASNLTSIENVLADNFDARVIEVSDESASHMEAHDSHFRVYIASDVFEGLSHIKRHRKVKDLLKKEGIMDKIHALSMTTRTEAELEKSDPEKAQRYPCLGGSKFDKQNSEGQSDQ
jgi:BolA protein